MRRFLDREPLGGTSAACLALAWRYRELGTGQVIPPLSGLLTVGSNLVLHVLCTMEIEPDQVGRDLARRLLYGSLVAHLVTVVAELGVADLVADQPQPVAELAGSTGTDPDALSRALRTLAGQGVFTEGSPPARSG